MASTNSKAPAATKKKPRSRSKPVIKIEAETNCSSITSNSIGADNTKGKAKRKKQPKPSTSSCSTSAEASKKRKIEVELTPSLTFAQTSFIDYNGESSSTMIDSDPLGSNSANGSMSASTPVTTIEYDFDAHLNNEVMNDLTTTHHKLASQRHHGMMEINGMLGNTPNLNQMLCQPPLNGSDLCGFSDHNIGLESVLNCVNSTENSSTHDGVPESAFGSPFDHSVSSHPGEN